jgi:hypothetical protein
MPRETCLHTAVQALVGQTFPSIKLCPFFILSLST